MTSRDYTKEIGIHSQKKTLSRPMTVAVLVAVAVGASFGVAGVLSQAKERHPTEKNATAQPAASSPAASVPAK